VAAARVDAARVGARGPGLAERGTDRAAGGLCVAIAFATTGVAVASRGRGFDVAGLASAADGGESANTMIAASAMGVGFAVGSFCPRGDGATSRAVNRTLHATMAEAIPNLAWRGRIERGA
jgi:hypothetical protein